MGVLAPYLSSFSYFLISFFFFFFVFSTLSPLPVSSEILHFHHPSKTVNTLYGLWQLCYSIEQHLDIFHLSKHRL